MPNPQIKATIGGGILLFIFSSSSNEQNRREEARSSFADSAGLLYLRRYRSVYFPRTSFERPLSSPHHLKRG